VYAHNANSVETVVTVGVKGQTGPVDKSTITAGMYDDVYILKLDLNKCCAINRTLTSQMPRANSKRFIVQ